METEGTRDRVHAILNRKLFFVKDAVKSGDAKTSDKFDILDPETGNLLLECREPSIKTVAKIMRFVGGHHDKYTAFDLVATIPESQSQIFRITRKAAKVFANDRLPIEIRDSRDEFLCSIRKAFLSITPCFRFYRNEKDELLKIKIGYFLGGWKLMVGKKEVARVVLNWKQDHQDIFKQTKSTWAVSFAADLPPDDALRLVFFAFTIAIRRILE